MPPPSPAPGPDLVTPRWVTPRWLMLADDLTGAADCGIAFARRGHAARVGWRRTTPPGDGVLALDADSRRLSPDKAAARHVALLRAHGGGARLIKKMDSTLRGQPMAELAATLRERRAAGRPAMAIVAPAFPATGRTTVGGRVRLNGAPLEGSPVWRRDHTYPDADLVAALASAGLSARVLTLGAVRGDADSALRSALREGLDAVVCDAETAADLDAVARAGLPLGDGVIWVGSGGIAAALANAAPGGDAAPPGIPPPRGGALVVVGSVAEASRAAAARLEASGATAFDLPAATLRDRADKAPACEIADVLDAGRDALVRIAAEPGADLADGAALSRALAALLAPAAIRAGALFATGGETALAILNEIGAEGLALVEEVEPGVPLGVTLGARRIPVLTKAGAFGDSGTILRGLGRLRHLTRESAA